MRSSENQHSQPNHSYPQLNYIVPYSSFSSNSSSKDLASERLLTPDPSPSMNPEDPKDSSTKVPFLNTNSVPSSPRLSTEKEQSLSTSSEPFIDMSKGANSAPTSSLMSSPSSSSPSVSRPIHSLYPNATPPMSPAHALPSPASYPYHASADHSQQSSGFYQLPPPLQSFKPRDRMHQSPTMSPLQSQQPIHNGGSLPLPSPRSSHTGSYSGVSPRSNPQQSPHIYHSMSSPSIGPLSPYPTPQNYPQYQSSPHQSPRYESHQPKHSIPPSMSLPASSLSSTSVFQVLPSRPYPAPHSSSQSTNNSTSHGSQLKSPRSNVSQRSAPNSPQRFMMLPPQTAPTMALARQSGTQSKTSSATGTKRRSSSGAKAVDQETREMMRKVSHSAIERRRRERINDKILQLKHLVPACVDEDHLHKLSILQSTIEYIQYLKSVIPESIANAKFQKATNNNPNNKTTDMLEALGSNSSTMSFAPMMTTGLDHPYSKRTKSDQSSGSRQDTPNSGSANHPDDLRRPSATQSLSDEDAKDGLMLLSQMSSGALSTNASSSHARERRTRSQSSGGSLSMDREKNNDTMEYRNKTRQSKKSKGNDNDDDEDEEAFHNGSEDSGDSEDEEYLGDDVVEASGMEDIQSKEGPSCQNSKMSVEQMLC